MSSNYFSVFNNRGQQRGESQVFDKLKKNKTASAMVSSKSNSAMVSSEPNSAVASSSSGLTKQLPTLLTAENAISSPRASSSIPFTVSNLKMPARVTPAAKLFKPTKRKQSEKEPDSDDDFKEAPPKEQLVLHKKNKANPFGAAPLQRQTFDSNGRTIRTDDADNSNDFRIQPKMPQFWKPAKVRVEETKRTEEEVKTAKEKKEQLYNKLEAVQRQENSRKGKKKCPYCSEILFPMVPELEKALKSISSKDKEHRQKQTAQMEKENATSSYSTPLGLITKRHVSNSEKDKFCSLHHKELAIKPNGIKKGYPTNIDFSAIETRISSFDSELKDIISNKIRSDYRTTAENAYKEQGITKARSAMSVLNRFEATLPGYYGPKGSATILDALSKRYLQSGYLQKELVSPQLPLEFLQQVLVPEAGFRLIRQDMIRKEGFGIDNLTSKAKTIMADSCEFGNAMYPVEEVDMEEDEIETPTTFVLSDDSDEEEDHYASDQSEEEE